MSYKYWVVGACAIGASYGLFRAYNSVSFYINELAIAEQKRKDEIEARREKYILALKASLGTLFAGLSIFSIYKLKSIVFGLFNS